MTNEKSLNEFFKENLKILTKTDFFRFEKRYESLEEIISKENLKNIKFLSLGCSIGCEVYSFKYFFEKKGYHVEAYGVDYKKENILIATNGIYTIKRELYEKYRGLFRSLSITDGLESYFKELNNIKSNHRNNLSLNNLLYNYQIWKDNNEMKFIPKHNQILVVRINDKFMKDTFFYHFDILNFLKRNKEEKFDVIQYTLVENYIEKKKALQILKYISKKAKYVIYSKAHVDLDHIRRYFAILNSLGNLFILKSRNK